jgi:hypothetical protein
MSRRTGFLLMVTGIGHFLVGLALFPEPLAAIVREGILNTIPPRLLDGVVHLDFHREAAFWFVLYGPLLYLQGQIANRAVERGDAVILRLLAWNLLATGAVGAAIMPVSGFWFVIGLAALGFRDARRLEAGRGRVPAAPPLPAN